MVYVSSDWHGWPLTQIKQLLARADFGDEDFLFVLGDVIDRGKEGAQLLRWLTQQPNVQLILGNHEAMLLSCKYLFAEVSEDTLSELTAEKLNLFQAWLENGGGPTATGLKQILKENPDELEGILEYLHDAPLYEMLEVKGQRFILTHAGIANFDEEKPLDVYEANDFLWARPSLNQKYYKNATVIFGHTPTIAYGEAYKGKPIFSEGWICVDTGAASGLPPVLLRLDDMKVFY